MRVDRDALELRTWRWRKAPFDGSARLPPLRTIG